MNEFITRQEFTEGFLNAARRHAEGLCLESCKEIVSLRFEGLGMKAAAAVYLMIACDEWIKREEAKIFP